MHNASIHLYFESIEMVTALRNVMIQHVKEGNYDPGTIQFYQKFVLDSFLDSPSYLSREIRLISQYLY